MSSHSSFGSTAGHQEVMLPSRQRTQSSMESDSVSAVLHESDAVQRRSLHHRGARQGFSAKLRVPAMFLVALTGLTLSGYLAWTSLTGSPVVGCDGGTFDCNHVLTSRWSKVMGIPVGFPAAGMYLMMIGCLIATTRSIGTDVAWAKRGLTFGAMAAALAATWFIGLQVFAVGKLCVYCMAAHACGLLMLGLVLTSHSHRALGKWRISTAAFVAVAAMIIIQLQSTPPPTYRIETHEGVVLPGVDVSNAPDNLGAPMGDSDGGLFEAPDVFDAPNILEVPEILEAPEIFDAPDSSDPIPMQPSLLEPVQELQDTLGTSKTNIPARGIFPSPLGDGDMDSVSPNPSSDGALDVDQDVIRDPASAILSVPRSDASTLASTQWSLPWFSLLGVVAAPAPADAQETEGTKEKESKASASADEGGRLVPVSSGRRQLRIDQWPLYGSPSAKHVIVKMFDYTCSHCRSTHHAIRDARNMNKLDLAVVTLPVPLHRSCNDAAKSNDPTRAQACEIARYAVTVWLADRSVFTAYHDWLMATERSGAEARAKAVELVGQQAFDKQLQTGTASKYIAKDVFLYKEAGAGTLPKLVFPKTTVVGEVSSATTISNMVRSNTR